MFIVEIRKSVHWA